MITWTELTPAQQAALQRVSKGVDAIGYYPFLINEGLIDTNDGVELGFETGFALTDLGKRVLAEADRAKAQPVTRVCAKHNIEMVEMGDEPDCIWYCADCELDKEIEIAAQNEPDEWDDATPQDTPPPAQPTVTQEEINAYLKQQGQDPELLADAFRPIIEKAIRERQAIIDQLIAPYPPPAPDAGEATGDRDGVLRSDLFRRVLDTLDLTLTYLPGELAEFPDKVQSVVTDFRNYGNIANKQIEERDERLRDLEAALAASRQREAALREAITEVFRMAEASADGQDEINEFTPDEYIGQLETSLIVIRREANKRLQQAAALQSASEGET